MTDADPHDEIVRLEAYIDELTGRIESCRKFILAARVAFIGAALLLAASLIGVIRFDLRLMLGAAAALLGGVVMWGSNDATAKEAAKELAAAEDNRALLIEQIELRVVDQRPTLH